MVKIQFKPYDQRQLPLFSSTLDEKIPLQHPVRIINHIIDGLDLTVMDQTYQCGGTTPYNPRMLLKVVVYAYLNNIYSCRKIADLTQYHIHYMWLSGNQNPSYSTINRFRSEHIKYYINQLFVQIVELLVEKGLISLDVQYIDGTKIESVANKYTFVWRKSVERYKGRLIEKINNILEQIEAGIAQDNQDECESISNNIDSSSLQAIIDTLNQNNKVINCETKEAIQQKSKVKKQLTQLQKHQQKLHKYETDLQTLGNRNSYSKTDKSATFMRMKEDSVNNPQTKPGYNVQIGTEEQFITNFGIYYNPGDTLTLIPFLSLNKLRFNRLPKTICADAGYGSEQNYEVMDINKIEAYVKYNYYYRDQQKAYREDIFRAENFYYNEQKNYFVCPMGQHLQFIQEREIINDNGYKSTYKVYAANNCQDCPMKEKCTKEDNRAIVINLRLLNYKKKACELLNSEQGIKHRKKRSIEPESVFGQLKFNMGYKRFRHRGFDKIQMDFGLLAIAFNLKKMCKKLSYQHFFFFFQQKSLKNRRKNCLFGVLLGFSLKNENCLPKIVA